MSFQVGQAPTFGACVPMGRTGAPQDPQLTMQAQAAMQQALIGMLQALSSLLNAAMQQGPQGPAAPQCLANGMPGFGMPMSGGTGSPMPFLPLQRREIPQTMGLPVAGPTAPQGKPGATAPQDVQAPQGGQPANPATKAGQPSGVPGAPDTVPTPKDKPTDPNKTVDDYLNANNGLLKNMGNQEGMKDKLKERYGNWEDPNRSEAERKQSAFNASRHVGIIKNMKDCEGGDRGDVVKNGKMEGCTKDGDIRSGTEMAALKDSLKGDPTEQQKNTDRILGNPNLPSTNNARDAKHVRKDGTNRDNAEVVGRDIGQFFLKGISTVFGGLGSLIGKTLGKIPGIGKLLAAPAEALFGTISKYSGAGADIVGKDLQGKDKKDVLDKAGRESAGGAVGAFVGIVDPTGALSGIADNAVQHAIDPDKVAFDPGKAALQGMDPTGGLISGQVTK